MKMRLTQKKIEEILQNVIGEEGLVLVRELYSKENVSEFDLASRTKKDIKVIRRMLYVLYNNNLVGFTRKKDKDKGWYIYYWTLLPENIRFLYVKKKKEQLLRLREQLEQEHKELFFVCPGQCVRLNFDQAMEFEFHCPECGKLITQDSPEKKVASLQLEIKTTIVELDELEKERQAKIKAARPKIVDVKKKPVKVIKKKKGKKSKR